LLLAASLSPVRADPSVPQGGAASKPTLQFPRDFGTHNDSGIEWWYVTGELQAGDELCGFQLTFFRSRTGLARDNPSRFAARQLLLAHAAVSDLRARRLLHAQRVARWAESDDETLLAFASTQDTRVRVQDWSLHRGRDGSYRARLGDRDAGFAYELQLKPTQAPLLQGDAGLSRKGPGAGDFSYYYSEPQLAVSGTLTRGTRQQAVSGRAWLDHEWSDALLPRDAVGWDWLGMNLDDGGALTAFRLRRADGSTLWAGGSHRPRNGATRNFAPAEVRFTPGRRWLSPATHASYPVQWTLDTPLGRHEVRALLDAQELDARASSGTVYWEGLSELRGAQGRAVGRGYLEMTGYAGALRG
jgi:predicted secreted hydrolase